MVISKGKILLALSEAINVHIRKDGDVHILKEIGCEKGAAIWHNDDIYIIYDESDTMEERHFTVAHELGHILLEHNLRGDERRFFDGQHICEYEADVFARGLLRLIKSMTELA